jgi:hypothetical protein
MEIDFKLTNSRSASEGIARTSNEWGVQNNDVVRPFDQPRTGPPPRSVERLLQLQNPTNCPSRQRPSTRASVCSKGAGWKDAQRQMGSMEKNSNNGILMGGQCVGGSII